MALGCLELLKKLKRNPCDLPDFVMNRDVSDIPDLLEEKIGGALRYACAYWAMHVKSSPIDNDHAPRVITSAIEFLKENAPPWIEVMSLEERLEGVIHNINNLLDWLGMIGVPTSGLDILANDCLRFTMHFFQLIQQSARHIYHSALPLSPRSSIFSSMSLPEQTRISDFYGTDRWGSVVRTIPGGFTCIATIGRGSAAKIAAACDDGTVRIYDAITGVLRLSLMPEFPIQEMTGFPDGSLLVCTYKARPFIALWDIQTGGLVHTFILKGEVNRTIISLKGRYLACETSTKTVTVWETAQKTQKPAPCEKFLGVTPCWLAPEELIMVMDSGSACIRNVATKGPPVHKFDISGSFHSAVYSQVFDRLAIMSRYSRGGTSFTILDVKAGTSSSLHTSGEPLSSIAFSQTTKQLVCGRKGPGLETLDISTGSRTRSDFSATATSVSTLSNGTVVANFRGSGIQLLNLDQEHAPPQQRTPTPLDEGRIFTIVPATVDRIILLETATMSQVLSIPVQKGFSVAVDYTTVIFASHEHKIAVRHFWERGASYLQMWEFSHQRLRWTVELLAFTVICRTSPSSARLVTYHTDGSPGYFVTVWDAHKGRSLVEKNFFGYPTPLDVTFDSEDRFYFHYDTHRVPYDIDTASQADNPATTHRITRREEQQLEGQVLEEHYRLDDGHEWVTYGSQRICWVPPEYIASASGSHWWAGSSLVTVGQDGTLRRLDFLE